MTRSRGGPPTQRQLRVGEQIRHALAGIFNRGELRDPDLAEIAITVTEVRISPDLKAATAFITPFAGGDATLIVKACKRAAPFLRGRVAADLDLKFAPRLSFAADGSFDQAHRIERLLERPDVARDLDDPKDGETT